MHVFIIQSILFSKLLRPHQTVFIPQQIVVLFHLVNFQVIMELAQSRLVVAHVRIIDFLVEELNMNIVHLDLLPKVATIEFLKRNHDILSTLQVAGVY